MTMFSDCIDKCAICGASGGCLAGRGDDDFFLATKEKLIERLDRCQYYEDRQLIIDTLKEKYNFIYEVDVTDEFSDIIDLPLRTLYCKGYMFHIKQFDKERVAIWKVTKTVKQDIKREGDDNK